MRACSTLNRGGGGKKKKRGHRRHIVQLSITEKIEINDETLETNCIERERKRNVGKGKLKKERRKENEHKEIPIAFVSMQYSGFYCKITVSV